MSQASTFRTFTADRSSLLSGLASLYRSWFASERIYNPDALNEIGLGYLSARH